MTIQTYSPSEVDLYLAILYQVTDYSPDSLISISRDGSYYQTIKGGTGGVERVRIEDNTHTLTVSLSQTSPTNSVLTALATLDRYSGNGFFPLFAKDSSGNSIFISTSCWIESPPEASYTSGIETRTWSIKCHDLVFGLAGNETDRNVIEQVGQLSSLIGQAAAGFL